MKSFARVFLPAAIVLLVGCRETSQPAEILKKAGYATGIFGKWRSILDY